MMRLLGFILLLQLPASAQMRVAAPVAPTLPGFALPTLSPTLPGLASPSPLMRADLRLSLLPAVLPAASKAPAAAAKAVPASARLFAVAAPSAGAQAAPAALKTAAEMEGFASALAAGRSDPAALATGLSHAYEGSRQDAGAASVEAAAPAAATSGLIPARKTLSSVRRTAAEPAPAPPAGPSGWRKALEVAKKAGSVLIGIYGGMQLGDVVYSLLVHRMPLAGGLLATAGIAAGVLWLRRTRAKSGRGPLMPSLAGTFAGIVLGNLLWTLAGSPVLGLGAGLVIGLAAGLYAGGILFPDGK